MTAVEALAKPGQRRDPQLDEVILESALAMFAEGGYRATASKG